MVRILWLIFRIMVVIGLWFDALLFFIKGKRVCAIAFIIYASIMTYILIKMK